MWMRKLARIFAKGSLDWGRKIVCLHDVHCKALPWDIDVNGRVIIVMPARARDC